MTWGGIKKGDRGVRVVSPHGVLWVSEKGKVFTEVTLDDKRRRDAALRTVNASSVLARLPLDALEQIAAIVTAHTKVAS